MIESLECILSIHAYEYYTSISLFILEFGGLNECTTVRRSSKQVANIATATTT